MKKLKKEKREISSRRRNFSTIWI